MSGVEWNDDDGIRFRHYGSYNDYVGHQAAKLATLTLTAYSAEFKEALAARLDGLSALPRGTTVLCLGARNGAECEVFIERGFFAIGIDLNPGESNKHVVYGDFHHLQFSDNTVDVVFTNTLDHAFEFDRLLGEVRRVLKPNGLFVAEIVRGSKDKDGREPGAYESAWWDFVQTVADRIERQDFSLLKRQRFHRPWEGDQFIYSMRRAVTPSFP